MADPYIQITNHVAQGLALLIEQYKNKPKVKGIVTSYLNRVQELENALADLYEARKFQPGTFGVYLDRYGKIVDAKRNSSDDLAYFTYIQAQIAINKSSGTIDEFIEVCRILTGLTPTITEYPATLVIELPSNTFTTDQILTIAYAFKAMVADGVRLNFIYPPANSNPRFTFSDNEEVSESTTQGFSSVYDTAIGGELVAVI